MRVAPWIALLAIAPAAWGLDFRSAAEPAVLYEAPSAKSTKLLVIARQTPVELIVSNPDGWSKVRDAKGALAWIETRMLSPRRTLLVKADKAQIFTRPDDKAELAFEAEKDVALDWVESGPSGWVRVKHRDGQGGFVRVTQVWGL
ncbi:MAG: SH3 domain-containing protein [Rhodocyclaceae bacterium]|jgi:SH3-like domain-containing protein|nr:SH3 domain-containing protein [Rhodocyclaceae bacterium]